MFYKQSQAPLIFLMFTIYFLSLFIGLSFAYFIDNGDLPIYNIFIGMCIISAIILIISLIIDLIARIFSKDKLYMDDDIIEYKNDKYLVSDIKFVEYFTGDMVGRHHEDANMTIYFENNKSIRFKNPPLKLILKLIKITGKKWFRINGLKGLFIVCFLTIFVLVGYALISKLF